MKNLPPQKCEIAIIDKDGRIRSRIYYIIVFKSPECACGKAKGEKKAFCYRCWSTLPKYMQLCLNRNIGDGFEEAYEDCRQYLEIHIW